MGFGASIPKFRLIPEMVFPSGSIHLEPGYQMSGGPTWVHHTAFLMGTTAVSEGQFAKRKDQYDSTGHPKRDVSWEEARNFAKDIGERTGRVVRLPSPRQMELAMRGRPVDLCRRSKEAGVDDFSSFCRWAGRHYENFSERLPTTLEGGLAIYNIKDDVANEGLEEVFRKAQEGRKGLIGWQKYATPRPEDMGGVPKWPKHGHPPKVDGGLHNSWGIRGLIGGVAYWTESGDEGDNYPVTCSSSLETNDDRLGMFHLAAFVTAECDERNGHTGFRLVAEPTKWQRFLARFIRKVA